MSIKSNITYIIRTCQDDTHKYMPSRRFSKSIDDLSSELIDYEMMAENILKKLRKILSVGYSEALLNDYEYIISTITLLHLNIKPRNITKLTTLYNRYSNLYNME